MFECYNSANTANANCALEKNYFNVKRAVICQEAVYNYGKNACLARLTPIAKFNCLQLWNNQGYGAICKTQSFFYAESNVQKCDKTSYLKEVNEVCQPKTDLNDKYTCLKNANTLPQNSLCHLEDFYVDHQPIQFCSTNNYSSDTGACLFSTISTIAISKCYETVNKDSEYAHCTTSSGLTDPATLIKCVEATYITAKDTCMKKGSVGEQLDCMVLLNNQNESAQCYYESFYFNQMSWLLRPVMRLTTWREWSFVEEFIEVELTDRLVFWNSIMIILSVGVRSTSLTRTK
jgi:hypothetical protein